MLEFKKIFLEKTGQAHAPVVIFDLDGTLFDVTYRTIEILQRFINEPSISKAFPTDATKASTLQYQDFEYKLEATLTKQKLSLDFVKQAVDYWKKRFFTDEFVQYDKIYEGAAECVRFIYEAGAHVAYLSGRDIPNMSQGTLQAFERENLPRTGSRVSIHLKPSFYHNDLEFKRHATEFIRSSGDVIATFDNEPGNVQIFLEAFPDAYHYHVANLYANHLDLNGNQLYVIKGFKDLGFA